MKIEITCPECESLMRLDAENVGKQARCPVCSTITQIPLDAKRIEPEQSEKAGSSPPSDTPGLHDSHFDEREPDFKNRPTSSRNQVAFRLDLPIVYGTGVGHPFNRCEFCLLWSLLRTTSGHGWDHLRLPIEKLP